jgi:hypothetical protein
VSAEQKMVVVIRVAFPGGKADARSVSETMADQRPRLADPNLSSVARMRVSGVQHGHITGLSGPAARSSKQMGRHPVLHPLAGREPPDLVDGERVGAGKRPARVAGYVPG